MSTLDPLVDNVLGKRPFPGNMDFVMAYNIAFIMQRDNNDEKFRVMRGFARWPQLNKHFYQGPASDDVVVLIYLRKGYVSLPFAQTAVPLVPRRSDSSFGIRNTFGCVFSAPPIGSANTYYRLKHAMRSSPPYIHMAYLFAR